MGKKKKKEQSQDTLYRAIKPFIKDNRIIFGLLGAVGVGVALAAALGPDRAGNLVQKVTSVLKELGDGKDSGAPHPEKAEKGMAGKRSKGTREPKLPSGKQKTEAAAS